MKQFGEYRVCLRLRPVSYLPEGDVAVSVGVGGQVTAVGGERYRCDGSFVSVDVLVGERERVH